MKNTLRRALALLLALLLALSVCAFADEIDEGGNTPGQTVDAAEPAGEGENTPGQAVDAAEPDNQPADEIQIDNVDATPAETERELGEETGDPAEVEQELVEEAESDTVAEKAAAAAADANEIMICGNPIQPGTHRYDELQVDGWIAGSVTYVVSENEHILTLDGVEITDQHDAFDYGIFYNGISPLKIQLIGSNSITNKIFGDYGILSDSDLYINGDDNSSLTVNSKRCGINATCGGTLTVNGGTISSASEYNHGISADGGLVFKGGSLTAVAKAHYSFGFWCQRGATLEVNGAEIRCGESETNNSLVTAEEYLKLSPFPNYFHVSFPKKEEPAPTPEDASVVAPAPAPTTPSGPAITIAKVPARLKAKAGKKGKVTVSWNKIKKTRKTKALLKKIKGIEVQISTDQNFATDVNPRKLGKNKTQAIFRGLQKNTYYYVRVRYTDAAGGVSEWSKVKRVRTKK